MTEQIREAFEAFYAEKAGCNIDALRAARWGDNGYRDPFAASAWFGWQAALAQQPDPAMPDEDELQQRLQRHDEMREKAKDTAFRMGCPAMYELTTIRDIFEKVPAERIADCCREMGQSLTQARYQIQLMEAAAVALGEVIDMAEAFKVAELVIWIDDGQGEIETRMVDGDGAQLMSVVARPDVEGEA